MARSSRGGVSAGLFSSLNCGYGSADAPETVRENRRRVAGHFGLGEPDLQTLHQIHSTDVLTVAAERWSSPGAPKADGLVTDRPGVVLGSHRDDSVGTTLRQALLTLASPWLQRSNTRMAGISADQLARAMLAVARSQRPGVITYAGDTLARLQLRVP